MLKRILCTAAVIAALATAGPVGAVNAGPAVRWVRVTNFTSSKILRVRASGSGAEMWGPDFLGADETIDRFSYVRVGLFDATPSCRFDLLLELEDGREMKLFDQNVCGGLNWMVTDEKWSR